MNLLLKKVMDRLTEPFKASGKLIYFARLMPGPHGLVVGSIDVVAGGLMLTRRLYCVAFFGAWVVLLPLAMDRMETPRSFFGATITEFGELFGWGGGCVSCGWVGSTTNHFKTGLERDATGVCSDYNAAMSTFVPSPNERGPEPLKEVLSRLMVAKGWGSVSAQARLEAAWAKAVGPQWCEMTRAVAIKRGIFEVSVDDPVVHQEIVMLKAQILQILRDLLGQNIKDIRCKVRA